ncbi:MAG: cache domain-containing protein [Synergistaceae bacterium]|nr:cache domain-containing protein [Synergistaceae bacterium]
MIVNKRVPNTFDRLFYYFSSDEETCSIVLELELTFLIDPEILKQALNIALQRNAAFRPEIFVDANGQVIYQDNNQPADVYKYDGDDTKYFGTADMNGYLFRVIYQRNKIIISIYHAVTDGRGLLGFARTLLYYYLKLSGFSVTPNKSILTLETEQDSTETADPAELYSSIIDANINSEPEFKLKDFDMYVLPGDFYKFNEPMHTRRFRYTLDSCELKRMAHESKSTVLSVLTAITAQAVNKNYKVNNNELITLMEVVDLKPHYHNYDLSNFADVFNVPITQQILELDNTLAQAHVIRKAIAEPQLTREHLDYTLAQAVKARLPLINAPVNNPDEMRTFREGFFYNKDYIGTFCYSNIGRTLIEGDMARYVLNAEMFIPAIVRHPFLCVLSHNNKTVINLTQRLKDDKFPRALYAAFIQNNLSVKFADCGTFTGDVLYLNKLNKI